MDDSAGNGSSGAATAAPTIVDAWLEPLPGDACGEDLEYDDEFREMELAASGRAGNQFDEEGKPPDWRAVLARTQSLFERTRDLRVAICWARARVQLDGVASLPEGLRLLEGLLSRFWGELHPRLDDGDAYARVNAISGMAKTGGLLSDIRESLVVADRTIGELRGREIELSLGLIEPRAGEAVPARASIEQMLVVAIQNAPHLRTFPTDALARIASIEQTMRDHVGYAAAPELEPLTGALKAIERVMPAEGSEEVVAGDEPAGEAAPGGGAFGAPAGRRPAAPGLSGSIETRNDALRAIDMVCDYLERTEPSNPAQMMLRRASKLMNKSFVELVLALAPDALNEVTKVMGISAEELSALRARQ